VEQGASVQTPCFLVRDIRFHPGFAGKSRLFPRYPVWSPSLFDAGNLFPDDEHQTAP